MNFSTFTALSEIVVSCVVLYSIITNWAGRPLPVKAFGAVLVFEVCVNVTYMALRAGEADQESTLSTEMKIFFAAHGTLSLAMLIFLIVTYLLSVMNIKEGERTWYQRHPLGTWFMVGLWMLSVCTGEYIYYLRHIAS